MSRMLEAAAPALAKPLQPKTDKEQSKLKLKTVVCRVPQRSGADVLSGRSSSSCSMMGLVLGGGSTFAIKAATGR
jgi:tight adherence protein C